jgi:NAD(P)-dependent dehydrogenase (short-subunit alcohol dehydrogenase family)
MNLGHAGRHVLVTGASKGIGLAIARAFAGEGARLTLVARDAGRLDEAAAALRAEGADAAAMPADLSTDAGRAALHEAVPEPDILVNNAGAIKGGRLSELSMDDWRTGWDLKVFGYIDMCRLYLPGMTARGSGVILNIIGMGGRAVRPAYICGAAGNAALIGFTQALGAEAQARGVRVLGINPSPTLTDRMETHMRARARTTLGDEARWREVVEPSAFPFGRPKSPTEVAALAVMACSPTVEYLNGTVLDMDGGGQWMDR